MRKGFKITLTLLALLEPTDATKLREMGPGDMRSFSAADANLQSEEMVSFKELQGARTVGARQEEYEDVLTGIIEQQVDRMSQLDELLTRIKESKRLVQEEQAK